MIKHRGPGLARATILAVSLVAAGLAEAQTASAPAQDWVGSWGASPALPNGPEVTHQTIRQVVRLSLGGPTFRLRISNELGTSPLVIGAAHVAKPGNAPDSIDPATDKAVTFSGRPSITLPPGAPALSDPIEMPVEALDSVSVSLFVPRDTGPAATHPLGRATTYLAGGDQTGAGTLEDATTSTARFFLSGVEVEAADASAIVTLGDSITDGYGSTEDANRRWPDVLAERLNAAGKNVGVVDAGISGNRVLHDVPEAQFGPAAIARFDRDVLSVPGVETVILMESINDIGHPGSAGLTEQAVTAEDIIVGMKQLIARAHAHGIRMIGATLTPYAETIFPGYYSDEGETERQAVNTWIREGGAFDGVIDFDAVVRDPDQPDHILAAYDFGDHLHPNDAGYRKMGEFDRPHPGRPRELSPARLRAGGASASPAPRTSQLHSPRRSALIDRLPAPASRTPGRKEGRDRHGLADHRRRARARRRRSARRAQPRGAARRRAGARAPRDRHGAARRPRPRPPPPAPRRPPLRRPRDRGPRALRRGGSRDRAGLASPRRPARGPRSGPRHARRPRRPGERRPRPLPCRAAPPPPRPRRRRRGGDRRARPRRSRTGLAGDARARAGGHRDPAAAERPGARGPRPRRRRGTGRRHPGTRRRGRPRRPRPVRPRGAPRLERHRPAGAPRGGRATPGLAQARGRRLPPRHPLRRDGRRPRAAAGPVRAGPGARRGLARRRRPRDAAAPRLPGAPRRRVRIARG